MDTYRDLGTGDHFLANYAKVPLLIQKCPFQIYNIISFILEGNVGIRFFHSTFEIVTINMCILSSEDQSQNTSTILFTELKVSKMPIKKFEKSESFTF